MRSERRLRVAVHVLYGLVFSRGPPEPVCTPLCCNLSCKNPVPSFVKAGYLATESVSLFSLLGGPVSAKGFTPPIWLGNVERWVAEERERERERVREEGLERRSHEKGLVSSGQCSCSIQPRARSRGTESRPTPTPSALSMPSVLSCHEVACHEVACWLRRGCVCVCVCVCVATGVALVFSGPAFRTFGVWYMGLS